MTPREIMYAVLPAMDREDRRNSERLALATIAAHDPKKAGEIMKLLDD